MIMIDNLPKLNFDNKSAKIAGSIFKKLKKEGKIPPVKDLLIASTCISNNMLLLTYDNDFKLFEKFGLKVKILEQLKMLFFRKFLESLRINKR